MMRQKSSKQLGFSPDSISAVGYGTPPCVSRQIADGCSDYVRNVVMQVGISSSSLSVRTNNSCFSDILYLSFFFYTDLILFSLSSVVSKV